MIMIEVGKTYPTKMSDRASFIVESLGKLNEKTGHQMVYGYYVFANGEIYEKVCPLPVERLIHETNWIRKISHLSEIENALKSIEFRVDSRILSFVLAIQQEISKGKTLSGADVSEIKKEFFETTNHEIK